MNSSKATQPNLRKEKMIFQGRTEQLDWKKIASIDIDTLIHEGDASQLLDLIKPVTFCKADSEFDDGRIRIDPAFIKVFRISQLISEFLLASQEKSIEKLTNLEEKYNEIEKEKRKLAEEMLHLKEMLTSAKKELKKRKEMLASTQNEMLGENNSDEYDQCPYCSKKFLRPGYLLAHIQRRHQGLPANPLYTSYTPGASTVVCHHPHPPSLPHNLQQQNSHQQVSHNGMYDSSITVAQTQHGQALINHSLFPSVHTPSPSILYGSNQQLGPSNLSFSGSVTSLNNIPAHNQGVAVYNNNATGFGKRESFTQTAVNEKSSHLDLLLEEKKNISLENADSQQNHQLAPSQSHSSDNNTPDSLNQLPPTTIAANLQSQVKTPVQPPLSAPPSPLPPFFVDGSRSHPTADADHGGGDAVAMLGASTLINRELLEAEKLDVLGMQNLYKAHWGNLDEEKVVRDGTEDDVKGAMIFETTVLKDSTRSFNVYQSHLKEEGEVTKSPADVINQPQIDRDSQKGEKEFEELKKLLQASVQGELKSLISRLESQEQFWQEKLASLQQNHERQIQQLRQELQIQNGAKQNSNKTPAAVALSENRAVMANDKFHVEREIGDGENADNTVNVAENNGNVSPPSGIILVESKKNHVISSSPKNTQFKSTFGAPRYTADVKDDDGESVGIPVAKPRKSKTADMEDIVPAVHDSHSHLETELMSSAAPSPISTRVNVHRSTTQHPNMHRQHDHSSSAEPLELESYSEEVDSEVLAVIQPEEFHEGKQGNSIMPHSSDTGTFAANRERSQRRYQHPLSSHEISPVAKSALVPGMNKSGNITRVEEEMTATGATKEKIVKSDEGSDFTLSESVDDDGEQSNEICYTSPQKNDREHKQQHNHPHLKFSDRPGVKSSVKQTPVKKKYIFDANARKLVEVSPEDEDDDENEQSDNNDDLNNASSGDEGGKKRSQSQLDLVRAKTIMELERNIADIGLNPESTAIGMEEMKRALRHLKLKRQDSKDQIHDYDKFDEERNAVKTFAKFEATKSSIDRKLDAISQSSKKSQQSSLKKILTAVKSSGKNFRKRVASAVKKKHKSEQCSGDEEDGSDVEKRKRKPSSAPPLKTTFFSKARWTRKKKSDGDIAKNAKGKDGASDKKADEMESTSDVSSEESEEEIELPEFMENSNTSFNLHRRGSSSRSRSSERRLSRSGNSSHHNSTRSSIQRKGASSRPKSAKHLKRLNSSASGMQKSPYFHHHQKPSSAVTNAARKSSESSPFSNVDDYDDVDDLYEDNKRVEMVDNNSHIRNNGKAELFGSHSGGTKIQDESQKGNKDFVKQVRTQKPQENTSSEEEEDDDDDDDDNRKPNKIHSIEQQKTGRLASQVDKDRSQDEDSSSSESQSEDDWDESFATSNEILAKAKSSGVLSVKENSMKRNNENDSHDFENNDHFQRKGISAQQRPSSGNVNTIMREGKKWNNEEMSDIRLRQIKQYVSKSKKEVGRDETSFSEEDSQEDYEKIELEVEKGVRQSNYRESKQNPPRERKIAFSENVTTDLSKDKQQSSSRNTNPTVQKWATSIESESGQHGQHHLSSSPYNLGRSNQIGSYNQDAQITSSMKVSEFSSGDPQFGFNEGGISKVLFDNKQTKGNFDLSKSSWKGTPTTPHLQQRSQFLTSTPLSATSVETNTREMSLGQSGTAFRQQRQNSFDNVNDSDGLDDLLALSDDDVEDEDLRKKQSDASSNRQNGSTEISSFGRKNASAPMLMQPTNHHHLSSGIGGLANLRNRADAQNRLLQDGNRGSASSRNSWDSQK